MLRDFCRRHAPLLCGLLVLTAIGAVTLAVLATGGDQPPRPSREALTGGWLRSPAAVREAPEQARKWNGLTDVASFAIDDPQAGQVAVRMHDGSVVHAAVVRAMGSTLLIRITGEAGAAAEATITRLGQDGDVVMISGTSMVSFTPQAGG